MVGEVEERGEAGGVDRESGADFGEGEEDGFGGDVAYEIVAGKRAAAEPGESGIEAAAAGLVGGKDFFFGVVGAGMKMDAEFDASDVILDLSEELADEIGRGGADGVGEGDCFDADVLEPVERVLDDFGAPWFVIGIAEGHGDVNDEVFGGGFRFAAEGFDEGARFGAGHISVGAAEIGGYGVGIANGGDSGRGESAAESFFVDDDADDFGRSGAGGERGEELGHDGFAVSHLVDVLGRDEADGVKMAEAGEDEFAKVGDLGLGGDELRETLPRVTGAFDEFDGIHGERKRDYNTEVTIRRKRSGQAGMTEPQKHEGELAVV